MRFIPLSFLFFYSISALSQASVSLDSIVSEAIQGDHWLVSNAYQEKAIRSEAVAIGQLPDPKLRLAIANLPTDSLRFNQENMTQAQFGISQQFPRGDSLQIKKRLMNLSADNKPLERISRAALVKKDVSLDWLKLHQIQQQIRLLEKNRYIFTELLSLARANFRHGSAKHLELLDAELQITKLNDRIIQLQQQNARLQSVLSEWLLITNGLDQLPLEIPTLEPLLLGADIDNDAMLNRFLLMHPQLQEMDKTIEMKEQNIALAEEAYKPGFKLDANYGYRDDSEAGRERSDLFSVAVTFDLPIFPAKRQDARRNSAINQREAAKEKRLLQARSLKAKLKSEWANLLGFEQRIKIYSHGYLRQLRAKRLAALDAYSSSDGRFIDVSIAAISELESRLQRIALEHERAMSVVRINYLLAGKDPQLSTITPSRIGDLGNE